MMTEEKMKAARPSSMQSRLGKYQSPMLFEPSQSLHIDIK
jgi:hypothetical protein